MEKVKFKVVLGALSFAFFLFLGMNRVEAQSTAPDFQSSTTAVVDIPQGSFVNSDEARNRLAAAMTNMKSQLAALSSGNSIYTAVELNYVYYGEIDRLLEGGTPVPNSIAQGLSIFVTDVYPTSDTIVQQLRQTAINLLSN